jgi:hypothetical protein
MTKKEKKNYSHKLIKIKELLIFILILTLLLEIIFALLVECAWILDWAADTWKANNIYERLKKTDSCSATEGKK